LPSMFSFFSPETTALLTTVHADARRELLAAEAKQPLPLPKTAVSTEIARAILDAAAAGERDPERWKQAALAKAVWA
jgi:hypothetical protein